MNEQPRTARRPLGWRASPCTCILATAMAMGAAFSESHAAAQSSLPVFELAAPQSDTNRLQRLARDIAPTTSIARDAVQRPQTVTYRGGSVVADLQLQSGAVFVGDLGQLWKDRVDARVPNEALARPSAEAFLTRNNLRIDAKLVRFAYRGSSETAISEDAPGSTTRRVLSRQLNYAAQVVVDTDVSKQQAFPIVGGGGDVRVSVGDNGRVVGYQDGWRTIRNLIDAVPIIPRQQAIETIARRFRGAPVTVRELKAELAYYAAPGFRRQQYLAPVWAVGGTIEAAGQRVPMRVQLVAATQYGPKFEVGSPAPLRPGARTQTPAIDDERPGRQSWRELLVPRARADSYECGTSWIGVSQGLSGSAGNRQGFVDGCRSGGWAVNFDWGDGAAWESDFRRNDDAWVDAADLVFYTGHASGSGWVLNNPDDAFLHHAEVGGAADHYGRNDLEWLIVAACGPFQSNHFVGGTTNAFDRWRSMFDGMHVALGYGAVTYDNDDEGRRFMELTRAGWNVVDAWLRTASEIQPSTNGNGAPNGPTIYAVAMYAHDGDHCARTDRLWGMGVTCADVPAGGSQRRHMIWSGT